jgi:hypothetical protein
LFHTIHLHHHQIQLVSKASSGEDRLFAQLIATGTSCVEPFFVMSAILLTRNLLKDMKR